VRRYVAQFEGDRQVDRAVGEKQHDAGFGVVFEHGSVAGGQADAGDGLVREDLPAGVEPVGSPPGSEIDPGFVSSWAFAGSAGSASCHPAVVFLFGGDEPLPLRWRRLLGLKRDLVEAAASDRTLFQTADGVWDR